MARIHVLGASGAGTTTLGRALADATGVPHYDTDDYFWEPSDPPYQRPRPQAERLSLLEVALDGHAGWVLSGSLCGWGDPLIPRFELVVFLHTTTEVRLARLRRRERERFGDDALAPGGAMHATHTAFMAWAGSYDDGDANTRSLALHESWLRALPCPHIRLDGKLPPEQLVDLTLAALSV